MENNCSVDIINVEGDFSKYKVLWMPAFNLMNQEIYEKLDGYVKSGGTLVVTFRSGTRNWDNTMSELTIPGLFGEMAGIEVEEFDSLNKGRQVSVATITGDGVASIWCDIIKPLSAEVIGKYTCEFYNGEPAITVNCYGKGKVYYIGCDLDQSTLRNIVKYINNNSGVASVLPYPIPGVELIKKENQARRFLIVLNHNPHEVIIDLNGEYTNILTNQLIKSYLNLPQFGVGVLGY